MLRELREFCEDNNRSAPAPMQEVPALRELTFWTAADPALENEADPAVKLEVREPGRPIARRAIHLQRVVHDIRYLLHELGLEVEMGECPDVATAYELACQWIGGAGLSELTSRRRVVV